MKTISKLVFSAFAALATMGFNAACYAMVELEDLPCCIVGINCPTRHVSEGIPEVQQSAKMSNIIKTHGVTVPRKGAPGYDEWRKGMISSIKAGAMPEEQGLELTSASRAAVQVFAMCVGLPATLVNIGEIGSSIICPIGVGIEVEQQFPECEDPQTGPHTVVEITKVSLKEAIEKERETQAIERQIKEARERIAERDAKIARNKELMAENTRAVREAGEQLIHPSTQATSLVLGSSNSFL